VSSRSIISRFEVGVTQVSVGTTILFVTPELISEVYGFSNHVLAELRRIKEADASLVPRLMEALQNLAGLAAVQRISQMAVDEFLRLLLYFQGDGKLALIDVLERYHDCDWRASLLRSLKHKDTH
jgi:hypothetical protein